MHKACSGKCNKLNDGEGALKSGAEFCRVP